MKILRRLKLLVGAVVAIVAAMLFAGLPPFRQLDAWAADYQQRLITPSRSFDDAVLVAIDDASLQRLRATEGTWPYARDTYARTLDFLTNADARTVVVDILFTDARPDDQKLAAALERGAPAVLAAVAVPYALEPDTRDRTVLSRRGWRAGPEVPIREWADVALPRSLLSDRAAVGIVTVEPDADGVVRRVPLVHRIGGGAVLPGIGLAGMFPQSPGPVLSSASPASLRVGERTWRVDARSRVILEFGRELYQTPRVPFWQVLEAARRSEPAAEDAALREMFRDRVVFVGSTALLLEDAVLTPVGRVPGVLLAMQTHLALAHGLELSPASWPWNLLLVALAVALPAGLRLSGRDSLALLGTGSFAGVVAAWTVSALLLAFLRQPTTIVMPLAAALLFLAISSAEQLATLRAARLRLTNERLAVERTAELKSEFLAHVSHELRTPLTAILGFSRVLADEPSLPGDKRALVQIIRRNGEQLLWLVNNLLDQARIAASQMTIDPQPTAIRESIEYVTALLAGVPRRVGVELRATCADEVPQWLLVDGQRLQQIVVNLAANGLKFTERGAVHIHVGWAEAWLDIRVDDTGPGIPADALEAIFEAFNQGDAAVARRGGTGLGLTISRNLARLMGGELSVRSSAGVGSTFRLRIPAPTIEPEHIPLPQSIGDRASGRPASTPAVAGRPRVRAVIADDSEDIRAFLEIYLTRLGLDVTMVEDGRQAVDVGLAARPHVILLDVQMPTMGGVEAVRLLRSGGYTGRVVALTAGSGEDLQSDLLAAGFDTVIFKPVTGNELSEALARLLDLPGAQGSGAPPKH